MPSRSAKSADPVRDDVARARGFRITTSSQAATKQAKVDTLNVLKPFFPLPATGHRRLAVSHHAAARPEIEIVHSNAASSDATTSSQLRLTP